MTTIKNLILVGSLRGAKHPNMLREFKRGEAPLLKKPSPSPLKGRDTKGELKRGFASLLNILPPLLTKERGIKGVR